MTYLMDSSVTAVAEAKSTVEAIYKKIKNINYDKKDLAAEIKLCLLKNPALNIVHVGENKETLLILLVKENINYITKTVVRKILHEYTDIVYLTDNLGNNALMHAAMVNNLEFLNEISNYIASTNFNLKNKDNKTAFMLAEQHNHRDFLEKLFDKVSKEAQEESLLLAAEYGNTATVDFLLAKGVNVHVKDAQGMTPLLLANNHGHDEVVVLLRENSRSDYYEWSQKLLKGSSYLIEKSRDAVQYLTHEVVVPLTEFVIKKSRSTYYEQSQELLKGFSDLVEKSRDALQYLTHEVVVPLTEFVIKKSRSTYYEQSQELLKGFSYLIEKSRDALQYLTNAQLLFTLPGYHLTSNSEHARLASELSQLALSTQLGMVSQPSMPSPVLASSNSTSPTESQTLSQALSAFSTDEPASPSTATQLRLPTEEVEKQSCTLRFSMKFDPTHEAVVSSID